jgi:hypothetical protein
MPTSLCGQVATQIECLHMSNCGFCTDNNKCIAGNNLGPLELCPRRSYMFTAATQNWRSDAIPNNNVQVTQQNINGAILTTVRSN